MPKRIKVPISTARTEIFKLADLVRHGDDAVVVFEQRGGVEPVALVREARLAYLEERVMQLDKEQATPFSLAGSLTSDVSADDIEKALRELRLEWGRASKSDPAGTRKRKGGAPERRD